MLVRALQDQNPFKPSGIVAQGSGGHGHGVHSDSVVKIKSLPFDATQLDIIQFFENFKLKPNGVQLVVRSDNKPTGEVSSTRYSRTKPCGCASGCAYLTFGPDEFLWLSRRRSSTLRAPRRPPAPSKRKTTRSFRRSLETDTYA